MQIPDIPTIRKDFVPYLSEQVQQDWTGEYLHRTWAGSPQLQRMPIQQARVGSRDRGLYQMKKEQELGIDLKRTISQKYPFWVLVIIFIAAFSFGFVFNSLMLLNSTDRIDYMESLLKQHSTPQGVDYGYHFIINGSMTLEGLSRIYFTPQINPQARSILESQINKICKMAVKSKDLTAVPQSGTGGWNDLSKT